MLAKISNPAKHNLRGADRSEWVAETSSAWRCGFTSTLFIKQVFY